LEVFKLTNYLALLSILINVKQWDYLVLSIAARPAAQPNDQLLNYTAERLKVELFHHFSPLKPGGPHCK
jgi:hypothetical protein